MKGRTVWPVALETMRAFPRSRRRRFSSLGLLAIATGYSTPSASRQANRGAWPGLHPSAPGVSPSGRPPGASGTAGAALRSRLDSHAHCPTGGAPRRGAAPLVLEDEKSEEREVALGVVTAVYEGELLLPISGVVGGI